MLVLHWGGWVRREAYSRGPARTPAFALTIGLALTGCAVGPNYSREPAPVPTAYKELKGWKFADPRDDTDRGDWWTVYKDRALDELLPEVEISNQTVAADAAAYEEARALIREAQATLFPTATAEYDATRTRTGARAGTTGGSGVGFGLTTRYTTQYTAPISGSWDLDVWGRIRRQIESNTAAAQASAADLDNAKLSAQAQLATAYFNLRAADSLYDLLERTVAQDKETLRVTRDKVNAGCCASGSGLTAVSPADLALAAAQVENAEAQAINVGVERAQFEHAIAMLIGRPPSELTIAHRDLTGGIPKTPVTVPSALLERRPDIAASERTMQEENALIGVAEAAYFPDVSLSSMLEYIGPIPLPFSAARSIGSIGASGTQTLFNGGLTSAQVDAARAVYWQSVANYRQAVLTAFQQVEDELAAIHILSRQLVVQRQAVKDAGEAVRVDMNQYRAGVVDLTTVVTAENTLLADQEAELTVRQDLFLASVSLIEALGGGWDTTLLPDQLQLQKDFTFTPQLESTTPLAVELLPKPQTPSNPQGEVIP
jgi:NodT family efflux transporter outer membrane factor (OMF) lipoprotein